MSASKVTFQDRLTKVGLRVWAFLLIVSALILAANFGAAAFFAGQINSASALAFGLQVDAQKLGRYATEAIGGRGGLRRTAGHARHHHHRGRRAQRRHRRQGRPGLQGRPQHAAGERLVGPGDRNLDAHVGRHRQDPRRAGRDPRAGADGRLLHRPHPAPHRPSRRSGARHVGRRRPGLADQHRQPPDRARQPNGAARRGNPLRLRPVRRAVARRRGVRPGAGRPEAGQLGPRRRGADLAERPRRRRSGGDPVRRCAEGNRKHPDHRAEPLRGAGFGRRALRRRRGARREQRGARRRVRQRQRHPPVPEQLVGHRLRCRPAGRPRRPVAHHLLRRSQARAPGHRAQPA